MGHGLPIAVGMAYGKKLAGEKGNVYCIMSDGEMNEGTTWESALVMAHHKLNNLIVIVDMNGWQAMGKTGDILEATFPPIIQSIKEVDGHNYEEIERGLIPYSETFPESPHVLLAHTVKGKGVSFMENHLVFHYKSINAEEYQRALTELQ